MVLVGYICLEQVKTFSNCTLGRVAVAMAIRLGRSPRSSCALPQFRFLWVIGVKNAVIFTSFHWISLLGVSLIIVAVYISASSSETLSKVTVPAFDHQSTFLRFPKNWDPFKLQRDE